MDLHEYLDRISCKLESPSERYLKKLHIQHVRNIPVENLDIHYGRRIVLDYEKVFKKIVGNKRGGLSYEVNGLFYLLLRKIGFDCYPVSVELWKEGVYEHAFDQMGIVVRFPGKNFLADVALPGGFTVPKRLEIGSSQLDHTLYWKVEQDPDERLLLKKSMDNSLLQPYARLELKEKQLIEFISRNDYHQDNPESYHKKNKFIALFGERGWIKLTDRSFYFEGREYRLLNEDEFLSKLQDHFGISYDQLIPW